jgi:hypothetical protein
MKFGDKQYSQTHQQQGQNDWPDVAINTTHEIPEKILHKEQRFHLSSFLF